MIQGLTPDRWTVLSAYLDEVLDVPDSSRLAWLEGLRARAPAVADELEVLLAEYDRVGEEGFLERALAPRATLAGQALGAYTLITPLGQGGMGTVWLARRSDGRYEGQAAVKLLNASCIGREAEERFRREGHILARLRHPHIAHLVDAGVSPAGQPYLVLEHVDGEPIDAYCDRRRLGVRERVRLFLDVAAAVAHAHANLIVHRDLKPSNVLVDREGAVRLLDFGVAKLLAPEGIGPPVMLTREAGCALTPEYAAPEQIAGGPITTATDVYALGVLLYGLLSGGHPVGSGLRASPNELFAAILSREPARLSAAVAADPDEAKRSRAADRGSTPEQLRRALRGDLETIVARALKKDPAERYASVGALADDLRRYLGHEPIAARPDAFGYRAARFVRRNRLPVALVGVLLVALAAGLAGTMWQARAAARQRDLALALLERAGNMNHFTAFLLGEAAPGVMAVTVPEVLVRAEELAGRRAAQDPGLAVDLLVSIGMVHLGHQQDDARRCLRRAYELSHQVADPATRATAACALARSMAADRDLEGALRLVAEGLAFTSEDVRFDVAAAGCLLHRGSIASIADSSDLVTASAREALYRLDRSAVAQPDLRAEALHLAAIGQRMSGRTLEADATFAQAFEQLRLLGRDRSSEGATLLHNWSLNAANTSPLAALETSRRVLNLYESGAEDDIPLSSLNHHAVQLIRLGRDREARPILERAQTLARRRGDRFALVMTAPQLAHACRQVGDLACAWSTLGTARERLSVVSPGHRVRGDMAREEALLAEAEGRAEDVRRLLSDALTIHGALKEKHLTQVETYLAMSDLELRRGAWADAEARARAALDVAENFRGGAPRSSWVGRSLLALGAARQAQGDAARARELFTQALAHMTPTLGPDHPSVLEARQALAR